MTFLFPLAALFSFTLSASPGCAPALFEAQRATSDLDLARQALGIVLKLDEGGTGGPTGAVARSARALSDAADTGVHDLGPLAHAFREALLRHCTLAQAPRLPLASAADQSAVSSLLGRPEFRHVKSDPLALRRLILAAWAWLLERLGSLEAERFASVGRAIFLTAAGAAALLGMLALVRRRLRPPSMPTPEPSPERATAEPDQLLSLAEEALSKEDLRASLRLALLAALSALERAGRVPRGRTLTNGEMVLLLESGSRDTSIAAELRGLVRVFDASVYGEHAVSAKDATGALAGARRLRQRLREVSA